MRKKKKIKLQMAARKLVTKIKPKSIISEQFRTVRTNINFSMPDKELKTLLVTSSSMGEGKSTSAANMAIVFAEEGKKVLLIDADMRKPTMHYTFHRTNSVGLSNLLAKQVNLEQVLIDTGVEGLQLITSGVIPPNPTELLGSNSLDILLAELKVRFDMIIFDTPPVLLVADAQILSNKCDATILVVSSGLTERTQVIRAKNALQTANANLVGVILNNIKTEKDNYYYEINEKSKRVSFLPRWGS